MSQFITVLIIVSAHRQATTEACFDYENIITEEKKHVQWQKSKKIKLLINMLAND